MPLPSGARGGGHPEAHPTSPSSFPLILSEATFSSFTRSPQASLPSSPLTFELNIPSSPWTGIFYTSPNVVFVYISPCSTGNSSLRPLPRSIVFRGGGGKFFFWRISLVSSSSFFSFFNSIWDERHWFFAKILIFFRIFKTRSNFRSSSKEDDTRGWILRVSIHETRLGAFEPGQPCWMFKVWEHVSG